MEQYDTLTRYDPQVHIRQQKRKSLSMRVTPAGDVVVAIPYWLKPDHPQVRDFIQDGLRQLDNYFPAERPTQLHDDRSVRKMVKRWALQMGLQPGRVQFRAMTRKWGSCSSKGNITLNTALFFIPEHLVEYVVVHELVHMLVFDHSPAFWKKLGEFLPDHRIRKRQLDSYRV